MTQCVKWRQETAAFRRARCQRWRPAACRNGPPKIPVDSIDASPAFALPIHIGEVEPERELIKGQGGADAEEHRDQEPQPRQRAGLEQSEITSEQQQQDPPDEVVNVGAARKRDVLERPHTGPYQVSDRAHDSESDEEGERAQKQPLATEVPGEVMPVDVDERMLNGVG